jgi:hypothetical protein
MSGAALAALDELLYMPEWMKGRDTEHGDFRYRLGLQEAFWLSDMGLEASESYWESS